MSSVAIQLPPSERRPALRRPRAPQPKSTWSRKAGAGDIPFRARKPVPELGFPSSIEEAISQNGDIIGNWVRRLSSWGRRYGFSWQDLEHFGRTGLARAYMRFEPERGVDFRAYCGNFIGRTIQREVMRDAKGMLSFNAVERYESTADALDCYENGGDPGLLPKLARNKYDLLASGEITAKQVDAWLSRAAGQIHNAAQPKSLDAPVARGVDTPLGESSKLPCGSFNTEGYDMERLRQRVEFHLNYVLVTNSSWNETTKGRARKIFSSLWLSEKPLNGAELAEMFWLTRERVRQLDARVMAEMVPRLLSDPLVSEFVSAGLGISEDSIDGKRRFFAGMGCKEKAKSHVPRYDRI